MMLFSSLFCRKWRSSVLFARCCTNIILLHPSLLHTRFWSCSRLLPLCFNASFTSSVHLFFKHPLFLCPSTCIAIAFAGNLSAGILLTCLYHFSRLRSILSNIVCVTCNVDQMTSFRILSIRVTLLIFLRQVISIPSSVCSSRFFSVYVPEPYELLTTPTFHTGEP